MKNIRRLLSLHAGLLKKNPYCYFELIYTRQTGWMAWLCSKLKADDTERAVHAYGRGDTAEEAAQQAVEYHRTHMGRFNVVCTKNGTVAFQKPPARTAVCPVCFKTVKIHVPRGGDGSVDVFNRHKNDDGVRCNWSLQIVQP